MVGRGSLETRNVVDEKDRLAECRILSGDSDPQATKGSYVHV